MAGSGQVAVAASISILLLAGCSSPAAHGGPQEGPGGPLDDAAPGRPADDAPTTMEGYVLQVGARWVFRTTAPTWQGTEAISVAAQEDHEGVPAYRVEGLLAWGREGTGATTNVTQWLRVPDLAILEARTAMPAQGGLPAAAAHSVYDPACPGLPWPLHVGQTWTTACSQTLTFDGGAPRGTETVTTFVVEGRETVTVPAGTFDTLRLSRDVDGHVTTSWVSSEACGEVKSVSPRDDGEETKVLESYGC